MSTFFKIATAVGLASTLWAAPALANDNETWIGADAVALCEEIGTRNHVCPEILEAMIETESSGRADAYSGGCYGLMQVSASAHAARMARLGVTNLYDKRQNIEVGCDILLELYETYGDDSHLVLMKYNGVYDAESRARRQDYTYHAKHIVERARELETLHGKTDYSGYEDFY